VRCRATREPQALSGFIDACKCRSNFDQAIEPRQALAHLGFHGGGNAPCRPVAGNGREFVVVLSDFVGRPPLDHSADDASARRMNPVCVALGPSLNPWRQAIKTDARLKRDLLRGSEVRDRMAVDDCGAALSHRARIHRSLKDDCKAGGVGRRYQLDM